MMAQTHDWQSQGYAEGSNKKADSGTSAGTGEDDHCSWTTGGLTENNCCSIEFGVNAT